MKTLIVAQSKHTDTDSAREGPAHTCKDAQQLQRAAKETRAKIVAFTACQLVIVGLNDKRFSLTKLVKKNYLTKLCYLPFLGS